MAERLVAMVAMGVALVGATPPSLAPHDGWVEDETHDYVGLAVFYDADGDARQHCSGALVDDTTFVTAGHCTDGATSARVYFQRDAAGHVDPATRRDAVTGYPDDCAAGTLGVLCVESDDLYDFGFDGFVSYPDTHDVGLVVLPAPPSGVEGRAELAGPRTLDPLSRGPERNRTVFTVSGYGTTDAPPRDPAASHVRVTATSRITRLRGSLNDGFNLQTNGNGRGFAGTCSGVAGGMVFLGGADSDELVAVGSFGLDAWCRGTDLSYRLDNAAVLDWIAGGYLRVRPPAPPR
jgi:hypothetical protein